MPTVAPTGQVNKDLDPHWYAKLVRWWGFDPLDLAPMMGVAKKASTAVGKKELDQLLSAFKKPAKDVLKEASEKPKGPTRRQQILDKARKTGVVDKQLKEKGYYEP